MTESTSRRERRGTAAWLMRAGLPGLLRYLSHKKGRGPDLICTIRLRGGHEGVWTLDLGRCRLTPGSVQRADFFLDMEATDFVSLCAGELDVHESFAHGRLRYEGDLAVMATVGAYLDPQPAGAGI